MLSPLGYADTEFGQRRSFSARSTLADLPLTGLGFGL